MGERVETKQETTNAERSLRIVEVEAASLRDMIPDPSPIANKYTRGRLVAVGGSVSYPGAMALAASAAERMGAGYVEVFCDEASCVTVRMASKSLVVRRWDALRVSDAALAARKNDHPAACLIGSGFTGTSYIERTLFTDVMRHCAYPVVVDGGAITYLASEKGLGLASARAHMQDAHLIITPHFGEAARLSKAAAIRIPAVASAPVKIASLEEAACRELAGWAEALASTYRATVVLKGPDTFIASAPSEADLPIRRVGVMRFGTAALAKAGTGDVLAGLTASLLCQGVAPADAAMVASSLHALSARNAADELTETCVIAQDIICFLPETLRAILQP